MAQALHYCDACQKIIMPSDVKSGSAIVGDRNLCPQCAAKLNTATLEALREECAPPPESETPRKGTGSAVRRMKKPGRSLLMPAAALGTMAGLLVAVAAVLLMSDTSEGPDDPERASGASAPPAHVTRGLAPSASVWASAADASDESPREQPTQAPPAVEEASPPGVASDVETPAAKSPAAENRPTVDAGGATHEPSEPEKPQPFAELRGLVTSAEPERALPVARALLAELGEQDDAAAVRELMAEAEDRVRQRATKELERALSATEAAIRTGQYAEAAGPFRELRARYASSAWHAEGAGAKIALMLVRLEYARQAQERSAIVFEDGFDGYGDAGDASSRWDLKSAEFRDGVVSFESNGRLVPRMERHASLHVEVTATPKARNGERATWCGIVLHQSRKQYWEGQVREKRDGRHDVTIWEFRDLGGGRGDYHVGPTRKCSWEYGKRHRLICDVSPEVVRFEVRSSSGKTLALAERKLGDVLTVPISVVPVIAAKGCVCEFDDFIVKAVGGSAAAAAHDGYRISPKAFLSLAMRFDPAKTTPKKIATVGGAIAARSWFSAGLKRALPPGEGYAFASTMGLASSSYHLGNAGRSVPRALGKEKPELVRICFSGGALTRGLSCDDVRVNLEAVVDRVVASGAVPVLYTLPVPAVCNEATVKVIDAFNGITLGVADEKELPCIDAYALLNNEDDEARARYFRGSAITAAGHKAIDEAFLKLYRALEITVFGRGDPLAVVAAMEAREAGAAGGSAAHETAAEAGAE